MDQQPNMPRINPELNREEEKGKGGVLAGLLSRLGLGSSGAAGGMGGAAGAGLGGGLLATKAGIIGLALVGTTVAGSLGVVGYKLFGPGAEDRAGGNFSSIFEAKPPSAGDAQSGEGTGVGGVSKSLDYLVKANAKDEAPPAEDAKPADAAANADASASASAAAPSAAPLKNNNAPGQGPANKLKGDKKIGELSKMGIGASGGGGGSSAASSGAGGAGAGQLMAMAGKGRGGGALSQPSAAGGGRRGIASGRRMSAYKQLGAVSRDQRGANSSSAAGRTYDGGGNTGGEIAPDGGGPGGGNSPQESPSSSPGGTTPEAPAGERFPPPPTPVAANVTPWQAAINTAMLLAMAGIALLFLANKVGQMSNLGTAAKPLAYALAGLAALCGLAVIYYGAMIGGGKYGQTLQGGMLSAAGGLITATAAIAITGMATATEGFMSGGCTALMYVCGGAALAALAVGYMSKPRQYPASLFDGGRPPDHDHDYKAAPQASAAPSENVLDEYLA